MTHKPILILLAIAALIATTSMDASAGVRCSGKVITEGDTTYETRKHCGEPDHIDSWEEERILRDFRRRRTNENDIYRRGRGYREPLLVKETMEVEIWTYDWGPSRLIHRLRFENGKLRDIETGGYGN